MKSDVLDDGRWHHTIRQSDLNTFDICAERARWQFEGIERRTSDAAAVGTAVHAGIEYGLGEMHLDNPLFDDEIIEYTHRYLDDLDYDHVKWKTDRGAHDFLDVCITNWCNDVYPTLEPIAQLEQHFHVPLIEDNFRIIDLSGTVDYIPMVDGDVMRDWKTSGRGPYDTWQYQRWAIQPTVYTYAARILGWVDGNVIPFEYVVLGRHGVQRFIVERTFADWDWLIAKCEAMCELVEAQVPVWPRQDNHALCSEKWCDAWTQCKGRHVRAMETMTTEHQPQEATQ